MARVGERGEKREEKEIGQAAKGRAARRGKARRGGRSFSVSLSTRMPNSHTGMTEGGALSAGERARVARDGLLSTSNRSLLGAEGTGTPIELRSNSPPVAVSREEAQAKPCRGPGSNQQPAGSLALLYFRDCAG